MKVVELGAIVCTIAVAFYVIFSAFILFAFTQEEKLESKKKPSSRELFDIRKEITVPKKGTIPDWSEYFKMLNNDNTIDTNSGLEIRLTDNSPKEGDIFRKEDQVNRPLTDEEIQGIIKSAGE